MQFFVSQLISKQYSTANSSAPILMAMPAWVGALIGCFILFLSTSNILKKEMLTRKQTLLLMGQQALFEIILRLYPAVLNVLHN
ncbi:MAG: hypothetical protein ACJ8MO_30015 [Bacillus sp. (in: firmicutes)]